LPSIKGVNAPTTSEEDNVSGSTSQQQNIRVPMSTVECNDASDLIDCHLMSQADTLSVPLTSFVVDCCALPLALHECLLETGLLATPQGTGYQFASKARN
jgi:hypothetical protein